MPWIPLEHRGTVLGAGIKLVGCLCSNGNFVAIFVDQAFSGAANSSLVPVRPSPRAHAKWTPEDLIWSTRSWMTDQGLENPK